MPAPRRARAELARAALAGAAFASLALLWFSRFHLEDGFTAPDWFDNCSGVVSLVDGRPELWPLKRSRLAGLPAALLAGRLGIVDGMLASAVLGAGAMGAALYLWGSALGGPAAGVASVGLALALGPVVVQTRSLTFYPWITAALLACGAAAAWTARARRPGTWLLAGLALTLALAVDVRGLVWALPALGVSLATALRPGPRLLRVVALLVPLLALPALGARAFPGAAYTLEEQVDVRALYARMGSADPAVQPPYTYPSRYVPGRSGPAEVVRTVGFLLDQAALVRPPDAVQLTDPALVAAHVTPWVRLGLPLLGLVLVGLALGRRGWRALALAGTALPWAAALTRMPEMVNLYPRFLTQGLPVVALAGGLGVAALARGPAAVLPARLRWPVGLGMLGLVVFGGLPTPLSPTAGWRRPWAPELLELHQAAELARGRLDPRPLPFAVPCATAMGAGPHGVLGDWVPVRDDRAAEYRTRNTPVPPPLPGGIH